MSTQTGKIYRGLAQFTVVPNEFLQRTDLSWKAKGLFSYILSLPPNWEIYTSELQNHSTDGRDSTNAGFKELVDAGYICRVQVRDKGKFLGYNYTIHTEPITPKTEKPYTEKPKTEKPYTENPQLINKHSTNETYKNFYILSETSKIFQPNHSDRYPYDKENYVCFREGLSSVIIVPQTFIVEYVRTQNHHIFEGFLRNDLGYLQISEREARFEQIAHRACAKQHTNRVDDTGHFINIMRKVVEAEKPSNYRKFERNNNRETGYNRGTTEHSEGWK